MAEFLTAPFIVPLMGMLGIYYISKSNPGGADKKQQQQQTREPYAPASPAYALPNVDVPDKNYPSSPPPEDTNNNNRETDDTSQLIEDNAYYGNAYTDKYFNQSLNVELLQKEERGGSTSDSTYRSLTGESVGSGYFRHNNMQPFFGSQVRSSATLAMDANESILDTYAGQGSQTIDKQAMPPLFKPSQLGFVYGAPDNNEFYQSRVNASMRMANVKPFEDVQVGPGIGLGYTSGGQGGFNSGMLNRELWSEKGVDQLRGISNQKASEFVSLGHEVPDSSIKSQGSLGVMNKNRLDTSFALGEDRYFTTTGVERGQTWHATPVERYVSRPETSMSYVGGASAINKDSARTEEHVPSKHRDLPPVPVGIASAANRGKPAEEDYGVKSNRVYMNNRTANYKGDTYIGGGGISSIGAVISPLLDMLRPTRKETFMVENNMRPYANVQPKAKGIVDAVDQQPALRQPLPPTIRETTERAGFAGDHLNIQANAYGVGGYTNEPTKEPRNNQRSTAMLENYVGIASASDGARAGRSYEAEYNQRNNDAKAAVVASTGRMVRGGMSLFNRDGRGADGSGGGADGKRKNDAWLENTRDNVGTHASRIPNEATMGSKDTVFHERPEEYASTKLNRFDPDTIMAQLKKNPYVFDINNAFGGKSASIL